MSDCFIALTAPIEDTTVQALTAAMREAAGAGYDRLHLFISSPGGSAPAGLAAYNMVRAFPVRVFTYNVGTVASAGLMLYLAGERRFCTPTSRFLLHGSVADIETPAAVTRFQGHDIRHLLARIEASEAETVGVLLERTALTHEEALASVRQLASYGAEWAVAKGLAHAIHDTKIPQSAAPQVRTVAAPAVPAGAS